MAESNEVILALPWKAFDFDFANGEFEISGQKLFVQEGHRRNLTDQEDGDTGARFWDGAVVLAKYFETNPSLLQNKNVIELGAGLGLLGISAGVLQAKTVYITDLDYCKDAIEENINRNNLQNAQAHVLDWTNPNLDAYAHLDFVIASDVLWLEPLIPPLVNTLNAIANRFPSVEVYISFELRSKLVEDSFLKKMSQTFSMKEVYIDPQSQFMNSKMKVWHFQKKCEASLG